MSRLIGTVGFFNESTGRGVVHPDYEFQSAGISVPLTPEGVASTDVHVSSGLRITFTVGNGSDGPQAMELRAYEGTGVAAG